MLWHALFKSLGNNSKRKAAEVNGLTCCLFWSVNNLCVIKLVILFLNGELVSMS